MEEITYDGNGGSYEGQMQFHSGASEVDVNHSVKDTATFINWNTRADGEGDSYEPGDVVRSNRSSVTLYAQWAYEMTVVIEAAPDVPEMTIVLTDEFLEKSTVEPGTYDLHEGGAEIMVFMDGID